MYKLTEDTALVQTVDFITPVVDDPYLFGKIAACNSLSDIYAMGARPLTALNIVGFPVDKFSMDRLGAILEGGLEIMREADTQLLGGHTVDDPELKYGLAVTGLIHPQRILKNTGLRDGLAIILTKPLGTGILGTAMKADMLDDRYKDAYFSSMSTLNRYAAETMLEYPVASCTDVTGFGLLGHLKEMIHTSSLRVTLDHRSLPLLDGIQEYSETGLLPAGLYRNRDYVGSLVTIKPEIPRHVEDALFDPQTSGGLLIALPSSEADILCTELKEKGIDYVSVIGEVTSAQVSEIIVT